MTASPPASPPTANLGPTTHFQLHLPDATPHDPADNPTASSCEATYAPSPTGSDGNAPAGTSGINQWVKLCSVPSPAPGLWVLRVWTSSGAGTNQYGVRATSSGSMPASVYGINDISIYTNQVGGRADLYLAEIEPVHAGKKLELRFFDAGEDTDQAFYEVKMADGDTNPANNPTADCTWFAEDADLNVTDSGSGRCRIQTTELVGGQWRSRFNNEWITALIDIPPDYTCNQASTDPRTGCWWRMELDLNAAHDRTTWAARVIGNPVRLVPNR